MVNCIDFAVMLPLDLAMLLLAEAVTHLVTTFDEVVVALQLELLLRKAAEEVELQVSEEEETRPEM